MSIASRVQSKIKKDDKVKIIAGKDKGKIGKVLNVIGKKERIVVENINIVKYLLVDPIILKNIRISP